MPLFQAKAIVLDVEETCFSALKPFVYLGLTKGYFPSLQEKIPQFLNHEEQELFKAYDGYPKRQHSFLLGRYTAKKTLSLFLRADPLDFTIRNGWMGEPWIFPCQAFVSLAHSGDSAVALISDVGVTCGVDIEQKAHFDSFFPFEETNPDLQHIKRITPWDKATCQGALWTAQESFGKYFKMGLLAGQTCFQLSEMVFEQGVLSLFYKAFPKLSTAIFLEKTALIAVTTPFDMPSCNKETAVKRVLKTF